jgi:hypothetical protein
MKTIDRSSVNHSVAVMSLTIGASSPLVGPHRSSKAEDGCHCVTGISQLRNCCLYLSPEGVSFFVSFFVSFPESFGMKISLRVVDSSHQKGKFIHQSTCSLSRFITCSRILAEIGVRFDYLQTPFWARKPEFLPHPPHLFPTQFTATALCGQLSRSSHRILVTPSSSFNSRYFL